MQIGEFFGPAAASGTMVTALTSSITIIPGNKHRRAAMFYNYSEGILFLKMGAGASTNNFSVKLGSGSYFESPLPCYTGSYSGIWTAQTGTLAVTELTSD